MGLDVTARLFDVKLRERRVVRTGACDEDVVDWRGQLVEESPEPFEVGGIEGAVLSAPTSLAALCRRSGFLPVRITFAPSARARRAVSSPMPALPPITTTVCPRSSGSRRMGEALVSVLMIPPISSLKLRSP